MPELPEVETMRRGILGIVGVADDGCRAGCVSAAADRDCAADRSVSSACGGGTSFDVGRVGKRVVVHLDSRDAIVLEPRMTGLVLVADPPTREHLRFRCTLSGNGIGEFLYWDRRGLGNVRLFSPDRV